MHRITKAAINRPVTVIVTLLALIVFGIVSIRGMSLKLMPDINIPMMVVMTTYPGASPEEVDENVTEKIRESCSTISGLKKTIMQSYENYGVIIFQFNYGTDLDEAHEDLRSKIDLVEDELPEKAGKPVIMEMDFDAFDDMQLAVTTDVEDSDLLNIIEDKLEPQLRHANALADVSITGGDEKYIAVRIIPEYAQQYGVSQSALVSAITGVNFSMPAGNVEYGNQMLNMESATHYNTLEKIREIPIQTSRGKVIHLGDIADVQFGISNQTELSRHNGNSAITLGLKRKQSSNSVALSTQVKKILKDFNEENPNIHIETVYDSADEIVETLLSVAKTLLVGIAIAMAVIFVFFGDLKGSLIVGITMPISLLFALVCMYFAGISLNVVSLNGLVLSIGMITDNAVVVIEMCFKRQENGEDFKTAAYTGAKTVMGSVIGSTITTVVVYLPLVVLNGLSGQMFKQMGLTIVFVLLASLISAITFVPFFFALYKPTERQNNPVTKLIDRIAEWYGRLLNRVLNYKKLATLIAVVVFGLSIYIATGMPTELIAQADEGIINIDVTFRPNTKLENMDETVRELEQFITDSGYTDESSVSIKESSASATLTAYKKDDLKMATSKIVDEWNESLNSFSDNCEIKVSEGSTTMSASISTGASKSYNIAADDMDSLAEACNRIKAVLEDTAGILNVTSTLDGTGTRIMVDVDPEKAQANGFTALQVSQMVYMNLNGSDAGEVTLGGKTYDIKVENPKDYYRSLADVESMTLTNTRGQTVPITEIADIRLEMGSMTIVRTDGRFSATVEAIMTADTQDAILDELEPKMEELDLGEGVNYITSMGDEIRDEEFGAIGQAIAIALYLVFMVMAIQFESIPSSLLIMLCIPFATIGSVLMLFVMNVKLSMTALLGVLMLAGIVVNNGIIYIDTTDQIRAEGVDIRNALILAGKDRLRPILITTLTTELAMLPVAFKLAKNSESMQGMAVVIVGGLLASTILTLLLIPTFYLIFEKLRRNHKKLTKAAATE